MKRNSALFIRLLLVDLGIILAASAAYGDTNTVSISSTITTAIPVIKDIVNIVFFIVIGSIGVLSYLQARKTLFAPIKTETFKLQLKTFEELLFYFENLRKTSVDKAFDLVKIFQLNSMRLMDNYIKAFLKDEIKLDEEERKERFKDLVGGIIAQEDLMENWHRHDDYIEKDNPESKPDIKNPAVILAQWQKYRHSPVEFTTKFFQQQEQLEKFIASPLLPSKLKELLQDFQKGIHDNLVAVGTVLTEAAKELPEKYPSAEEIEKIQSYWLWNRYVSKRSLLEEESRRIQEFVTNYLKMESLLE